MQSLISSFSSITGQQPSPSGQPPSTGPPPSMRPTPLDEIDDIDLLLDDSAPVVTSMAELPSMASAENDDDMLLMELEEMLA